MRDPKSMPTCYQRLNVHTNPHKIRTPSHNMHSSISRSGMHQLHQPLPNTTALKPSDQHHHT